MPIPTYSKIDDSEIDEGSPVTYELFEKLRNNLLAAFKGDISGSNITIETDTSKVLKPNGSGGVQWADGSIDSLPTQQIDINKVLQPDGYGGVQWGFNTTVGAVSIEVVETSEIDQNKTLHPDGSGGVVWVSSPIITDWIDAGAITISGAVTSPTKGNSPLRDKIYWRRVGDSMEVRFEYKGGGTGSNSGNGIYSFIIPENKTTDPTKIWNFSPNTNSPVTIGTANVVNGSDNNLVGSIVLASGGNAAHIYVTDNDSEGFVSSSFVGMDSSTCFSGVYTVPISGWTTTTG